MATVLENIARLWGRRSGEQASIVRTEEAAVSLPEDYGRAAEVDSLRCGSIVTTLGADSPRWYATSAWSMRRYRSRRRSLRFLGAHPVVEVPEAVSLAKLIEGAPLTVANHRYPERRERGNLPH